MHIVLLPRVMASSNVAFVNLKTLLTSTRDTLPLPTNCWGIRRPSEVYFPFIYRGDIMNLITDTLYYRLWIQTNASKVSLEEYKGIQIAMNIIQLYLKPFLQGLSMKASTGSPPTRTDGIIGYNFSTLHATLKRRSLISHMNKRSMRS